MHSPCHPAHKWQLEAQGEREAQEKGFTAYKSPLSPHTSSWENGAEVEEIPW